MDGDTVYIQFHTDELKCARLLDITPDKLWFYDKVYKPFVTFKHEELYGLHMASRITEPSKGLQCFKSFEDAEKAYNDGKLSMTEKCLINDKQTTYGRAKITKLSGGLDIDCYSKDKPITSKNVAKLVSALGYHENRKKEYLDLQTFGAEVSTLTSFGGAVPYKELYNGDTTELEKILNSDDSDDIKVNKLNEYIGEEIKKGLKDLPDTNIDSLLTAAGKVSIEKLAGSYAPSITVDNKGVYVNKNETLLNGLSERAFNNMAAQNRGTLAMKQNLTPIGGFLQRQLSNLGLDLIFRNEVKSPDKVGIVLEGKDAIGRTDLNGNIITSDPGHRVIVKSCINNPTNIVYADEISVRDFTNPDDPTIGKKFNLNDGAAIGVAFGSDITEQITQGGLAFKHGGALYGMDRNIVKALESGQVVDVGEHLITIKGNHEYSYIKTECCDIYDNIKIGEFIQEGTPILKHDKRTAADDKAAMFNTLVKAQVVNDGPNTLGAYRDTSSSVYNITTGKIKYTSGYLDIGGTTYRINENDMYYYPVGYELKDKYIRLSDGIPDMAAYWDKSKQSVHDTYYIFYYHILTAFSGMNSDVFEVVFKCIYKNGFSLKTAIDNKESLIDRLYYGNSVTNFRKEIKDAEVIEDDKGQIETSVKLTDSIILPMILGIKYNET